MQLSIAHACARDQMKKLQAPGAHFQELRGCSCEDEMPKSSTLSLLLFARRCLKARRESSSVVATASKHSAPTRILSFWRALHAIVRNGVAQARAPAHAQPGKKCGCLSEFL